MSSNLYTHQSQNVFKTWILLGFFFALLVAIGYLISWRLETPIFFYAAIVISMIMNIISYWFSDRIVLRLAHARPASREEFFDLYTTVENLAITAGLPMPKLYVINDTAPNAFATGRDAKHSVVAVTTGLLKILTKPELEGVIAHELSHIGNKDMFLSTMVVVFVGVLTMLAHIGTRAMAFTGGGDNDSGGRGGQLGFILGLLALIIAPIAGTLLQLSISRKREYLADVSGCLLTRYPEGLASALEKIKEHTQPMRHASNATAHLYIANPFGGITKGVSKLFMTHPPLEDRIRILRETSL